MKDKEMLVYLNNNLEKITKKEVYYLQNTITKSLDQQFEIFQNELPSFLLAKKQDQIIFHSKKAFTRLYNDLKKEMAESIHLLNNYFCDAITSILENPLLPIEKLYEVKKEYLKKIDESFNSFLLKDKIANELSIMIYQYSIAYSLHQDTNKYQIFKSYALDFENKIYQISIDSFAIFKGKVLEYLNESCDDWFEEIMERFNNYKKCNFDLVCTYAFDVLNEKMNMLFLEEAKKSFLDLKKKTIELKEEIYKKTKKKDTKKVFLNLQDYLLSYHNALSRKLKDLFIEMNEIAFMEHDEQDKKLKTYQEFVYEFAKIDFNFEDCFLKYESYYIGDFSRIKKKDYVHLIVSTKQKEITSLMKDFSYHLLKSYLDILNDMLYRRKMVLSVVINSYGLVSKQRIEKLFKEVN